MISGTSSVNLNERHQTSCWFGDQVSLRMGNQEQRRAGTNAPGGTVDSCTTTALGACIVGVVEFIQPPTPTDSGEVPGLHQGTGPCCPPEKTDRSIQTRRIHLSQQEVYFLAVTEILILRGVFPLPDTPAHHPEQRSAARYILLRCVLAVYLS